MMPELCEHELSAEEKMALEETRGPDGLHTRNLARLLTRFLVLYAPRLRELPQAKLQAQLDKPSGPLPLLRFPCLGAWSGLGCDREAVVGRGGGDGAGAGGGGAG